MEKLLQIIQNKEENAQKIEDIIQQSMKTLIKGIKRSRGEIKKKKKKKKRNYFLIKRIFN